MKGFALLGVILVSLLVSLTVSRAEDGDQESRDIGSIPSTDSPVYVLPVVYEENDFVVVPSAKGDDSSLDSSNRRFKRSQDVICKIFKQKCSKDGNQQQQGYAAPRPQYGPAPAPRPVYGPQMSSSSGAKGDKFSQLFSKFGGGGSGGGGKFGGNKGGGGGDNIGDKFSRKIQELISKFSKGGNGKGGASQQPQYGAPAHAAYGPQQQQNSGGDKFSQLFSKFGGKGGSSGGKF